MKVYVLLTRLPDNGAKVLEAITGCLYSHASIGLSEDMNTFYSFVVKGFMVEKITRYTKTEREPFPCQLYEMEVSEQEYNTVKRILEFYVKHKDKMSYTKMGLVMSLLGIPFKKKYDYFCSQFVAEVLQRARVAIIKKPANFRMPISYCNGWLRELVEWNPDVIHSQCEFFSYQFAQRIAKLTGAPLVHHYMRIMLPM